MTRFLQENSFLFTTLILFIFIVSTRYIDVINTASINQAYLACLDKNINENQREQTCNPILKR